jgi:hypothetical protein
VLDLGIRLGKSINNAKNNTECAGSLATRLSGGYRPMFSLENVIDYRALRKG